MRDKVKQSVRGIQTKEWEINQQKNDKLRKIER